MVSDQLRRSERVRRLLVMGARYKQALDQASKTGSRQAIADLASGLRRLEGVGAELADICELAHVVDGVVDGWAVPGGSIDEEDGVPTVDDRIIARLSALAPSSPLDRTLKPSLVARGATSLVFRVSTDQGVAAVAKVTTPSARRAFDDDRAIVAAVGGALAFVSREQVLGAAKSLFDELLALASAELDARVEWRRMRLAVNLLAHSQLPAHVVPEVQPPSNAHTLIMQEAQLAPGWSEPSTDAARDVFLGLLVNHGVLHRQFLGGNLQPTPGGGAVIFDWASVCTASEDLRTLFPQLRLALDGDPRGPRDLADAIASVVELPGEVVHKLVERLLASVEPVGPWLARAVGDPAVDSPCDESSELPETSTLFGLTALAAGLLHLAGLRQQASSLS